MLNRRQLLHGLGGLGLLAGAGALPRALRAAPSPTDRRLLLVYNPGGWDPLSAIAPMYGAAGVQMSPASGEAVAGGLRYVDSPAASVGAFFQRWHSRVSLVHGLSVPSVSHEICTNLMFTGRIGADRSDWPSTVGDARRDAYTVPSLVVGGPSFPGAAGVSSARVGVNGQLQSLIDGRILGLSDVTLPAGFSSPTRRLLDRYALARAAARRDFAAPGADAELAGAWHRSVERASQLQDESADLRFDAVYDFGGQAALAVDVLARGLCRSVSISTGAYGSWDTHQNNDVAQFPMFDALFGELDALFTALSTTTVEGTSLLDLTTVVVLSEMGRTPTYNANAGRDHWPFTSVLLAGAGVAGDREVGAYDDALFGRPIDLASGEASAGGVVPSTEHLGATLLALADVDPGEVLPGFDPIGGVLA